MAKRKGHQRQQSLKKFSSHVSSAQWCRQISKWEGGDSVAICSTEGAHRYEELSLAKEVVVAQSDIIKAFRRRDLSKGLWWGPKTIPSAVSKGNIPRGPGLSYYL